ncbi:hypothetical protein ZWY2020_029173 [Hordeum vulgare]|nr:hypothetical protein ZWY2020_029173 [Hordeum vulgare]
MAPPVVVALAGDQTACPTEVFTVVHPTPTMVAWLKREMRASREEIAVPLVKEIGYLRHGVDVLCPIPEAFLIRFFHRHHYTAAASRHVVPIRDTRIELWPWRTEPHAEHVDMSHHVRLCLEGLPL